MTDTIESLRAALAAAEADANRERAARVDIEGWLELAEQHIAAIEREAAATLTEREATAVKLRGQRDVLGAELARARGALEKFRWATVPGMSPTEVYALLRSALSDGGAAPGKPDV